MTDGLTGKYPLDIDAIVKGMVITVPQVEQITGKKHGTKDYDFAAMALRKYILDETVARGMIITIKHDKGALRILQDGEASDYNQKKFAKKLAGMFDSHFRLCGVDRTKLDSHELAKHDRGVEVQSKILQSVERTKKELKLKPHERTTPASAVMRTRPRFDNWELEFKLTYATDIIDEDIVDGALELAGQVIGLCDWRPRFGRFTVL